MPLARPSRPDATAATRPGEGCGGSAAPWLRRIAALAAALWLVPSVGVAEPSSEGKTYRASALHRFGSCDPLPPNSPGGHGVRELEGWRIYQASALHPFAVGHRDRCEALEALAPTRAYFHLRRPGGPARGILVEVPVE
jgi:hypothetical protein